LLAAARGKAPGIDGIPSEAWKVLDIGRGAILDLFNRCWDEEQFLEEWAMAVVVAVF